MKTLHFYFDYISNNAYLAWTQLERLTQEFGIQIETHPVLFAGLLNAHGNVGPAELPAKRDWMFKNVLRKAALLNVPIAPPQHHPFNPLLALRASSMELDRESRWRLIDGLFRAVWVDSEHVSEPEVIMAVAQRAGLDGRAVLEWAQSPEASAGLRRETDDAVAQGVFGLPSMRIDDEIFFGFDDFPFVERYLRGDDPLDPKEQARWDQADIQPSSVRRRKQRLD